MGVGVGQRSFRGDREAWPPECKLPEGRVMSVAWEGLMNICLMKK